MNEFLTQGDMLQFHLKIHVDTLPETNSLPLKIGRDTNRKVVSIPTIQ